MIHERTLNHLQLWPCLLTDISGSHCARRSRATGIGGTVKREPSESVWEQLIGPGVSSEVAFHVFIYSSVTWPGFGVSKAINSRHGQYITMSPQTSILSFSTGFEFSVHSQCPAQSPDNKREQVIKEKRICSGVSPLQIISFRCTV